jgi:MinD superfamily P-loop ATPase
VAGGGTAPAGEGALPYIISTDCMGCGVCEFMCPSEAIVEAKNQLIILKHVCNGCGDCVPFCPVHAIVPREQFGERQADTLASALRQVLEPSGAHQRQRRV